MKQVHFIICWRSYGEWRCTRPFGSITEAEDHNRRYISTPDKDYNVDVTFVPVELPTIHETTFGGFVETIYGYAEPHVAATVGDSDVAEMIDWTMRDPKGPQIGWSERLHYWANDDDHEVLWRHRPTADDLDSHGDLKPEAIERRGV